MSTLKKKTIHALSWSFIDSVGSQLILFLVNIVLARMLKVEEFGLMSIIMVFITFSNVLLDGGFPQALIRKKECLAIEYNSVFFFNLVIGIFLFLLFFLSAGFISEYFTQPILKPAIRVTALILIINSFGVIQRTIYSKNIQFKQQAAISLSSSIVAGAIGISLAYFNFGLWALVWFTVSRQTFQTILFWIFSKWTPKFEFSTQHFKQLFHFGVNVSLANLINVLYRNVYSFVIGKVYSTTTLGYYSRAEQIETLVSTNPATITEKISYPILSTVQDDPLVLKKGYQTVFCCLALITTFICFSVAAVAKPLIVCLIGEKWLMSAHYLQILAFIAFFYPLQTTNLNILNLKGQSKAHLQLLFWGRLSAIPFIILGIFLNIYWLFAGLLFSSVITYLLVPNKAGSLIGYKLWEQIKDLIPIVLVSFVVAVALYLIGFLSLNNWLLLLIQGSIAILFTVFMYELIKNPTYLFIKKIIFEKIRRTEVEQ